MRSIFVLAALLTSTPAIASDIHPTTRLCLEEAAERLDDGNSEALTVARAISSECSALIRTAVDRYSAAHQINERRRIALLKTGLERLLDDAILVVLEQRNRPALIFHTSSALSGLLEAGPVTALLRQWGTGHVRATLYR